MTGGRPLPSRSGDAAICGSVLCSRSEQPLRALVPASSRCRAATASQDARAARAASRRRSRRTGSRAAAPASRSSISRPARSSTAATPGGSSLPASNEKLYHDGRRARTLRPGFRFETTSSGVGARAGATWQRRRLPRRLGRPDLLERRPRRRSPAQVQAERRPPHHRAHPRRRDDLRPARSGPVEASFIRHRVAAALGPRAQPQHGAERAQASPCPARCAARALRKALIAAGVHGRRRRGGGKAPIGAPELGAVQSEAALEDRAFMDRYSDNFTAEMVIKAVGALRRRQRRTAARHARRPRRSLQADDRRRRQRTCTSSTARASRTRTARPRARSPSCSPRPRPTRRSGSRCAGRSRRRASTARSRDRLPALRGRVLAQDRHARRRLVALGLRDDAERARASRSRS